MPHQVSICKKSKTYNLLEYRKSKTQITLIQLKFLEIQSFLQPKIKLRKHPNDNKPIIFKNHLDQVDCKDSYFDSKCNAYLENVENANIPEHIKREHHINELINQELRNDDCRELEYRNRERRLSCQSVSSIFTNSLSVSSMSNFSETVVYQKMSLKIKEY